MKTLVVSALLLFSASAYATSPEILKSCTSTVKFPGEKEGDIAQETMKFEFLKSGDQYISRTIKAQGSHDEVSTAPEELSVREGLEKVTLENVDKFDLNLAESLVSHAMVLTRDPMFGGIMSVDFDLNLVRSAKVYMIGKPTNMGAAAVVEAKDASGKVLGSYLGGFLVAPCK